VRHADGVRAKGREGGVIAESGFGSGVAYLGYDQGENHDAFIERGMSLADTPSRSAALICPVAGP